MKKKKIMKKYVLFVGLNDKDTKKQEIGTQTAINTISDICGECTISEAFGTYKHESGEVVKEKSLRVELLFKTKQTALEIAKDIKIRLNQESIGFEELESNSVLV